ncbi:MAG: subunit SecA of preprotein translocase, partial [Bryobacterales bacterium]|nr:subunit SecA of preprotein translocase [Bryobacterales bacterium]
EGSIEGQRQMFAKRREQLLFSDLPEFDRLVALRAMDDQWSMHLSDVTELRAGIQWIAWGGRDPLHEYLTRVHAMFQTMIESLDDEIALALEQARTNGIDPSQRGSTWTYLTTDNPFGSFSDRIRKGFIAKAKAMLS